MSYPSTFILIQLKKIFLSTLKTICRTEKMSFFEKRNSLFVAQMFSRCYPSVEFFILMRHFVQVRFEATKKRKKKTFADGLVIIGPIFLTEQAYTASFVYFTSKVNE